MNNNKKKSTITKYLFLLLSLLLILISITNIKTQNRSKNIPSDTPPDYEPTEEDLEHDIAELREREAKHGAAKVTIKDKDGNDISDQFKDDYDDNDNSKSNSTGASADSEKNDVELNTNDSNNSNENDLNDLDGEQNLMDDEYAKKVVEELGLDKKEIITKDDFSLFLQKVMQRQETNDDEEKEFYQTIQENILADIPDSFPNSDFEKYASQEIFQKNIEKVMQEKFGINSLDELKDQLKDTFGALSDAEGKDPKDFNPSDLEGLKEKMKGLTGEEGFEELMKNMNLGNMGDLGDMKDAEDNNNEEMVNTINDNKEEIEKDEL